MNNEPAFPINEDNICEGQVANQNRYSGLTKREWFTGMALMGICANGEFLKYHETVNLEKVAVKIADDAIAELEK